MTFSIVALDPETGDLGVAVASKFLAVGSVVPWARAGVGAVATQALGERLLRRGRAGSRGVRRRADDRDRAYDRAPTRAGSTASWASSMRPRRSATYTGSGCFPWAGGRAADGLAAQGNILSGPEVVDALVETFQASGGTLTDRLLAALLAADRAGGDARGRQSAAILIVRADGGYNGGNDRWIDLRVDDHPDPVPELARLYGVWRLLSEPPEARRTSCRSTTRSRPSCRRGSPAPAGDLAARTRSPRSSGPRPRSRAGSASPGRRPTRGRPGGTPSSLAWMGFANFEERAAAMGWIDPQVLRELRMATGE